MADKNMDIRVELTKAGMSQDRLAELMGVSRPAMNMSLNVVEWSQAEKNRVKKLIRDNAE
jgi:predicted transcriptional regulator